MPAVQETSCYLLKVYLGVCTMPVICLSSTHLSSACLAPCPPQRIPERIVEKAVKGMLPKGRIASILFSHLKVGNSVIYAQACMHTDPFPNTLAHTFRLLHC